MSAPVEGICDRCGASNWPSSRSCWTCEAPLPARDPSSEPLSYRLLVDLASAIGILAGFLVVVPLLALVTCYGLAGQEHLGR